MKNNNYKEEKESPAWIQDILKKLNKNPKLVFKAMVLFLGVSILFSVLYSVFKPPYERKSLVVKDNRLENSLSSGLGELINAGTSINEINSLDLRIKTILAKPELTRKDSTDLLNSLNELENIHKRLNPKKK